MNRGIILIIITMMLVTAPGVLCAAIPASERAALIAFYNAADMDTWWDNHGWKNEPLEPDGFGPIGSEGTWAGITVQDDHVVEIFLGNYERQKKKSGSVIRTIAPELGNLPYLRLLSLFDMDLTGGIPPELGNLKQLTYLELGSNSLTGTIPPKLGNLSNLTYLILNYNQLTGTIPPELGNLGNLERILLDNNQLTGISPELGNLPKLYSLGLSYNQLKGNIPPELGKLSSLEYLFLDNNQLTGSIPPELANLDELKWLYLGNNLLTSIPPELGNLATLVDLYLNDNQLTSIPPELGNLKNLSDLSLGNNRLSGSIPLELGNLKNLNGLSLENNRLTGSIPPELGNLRNLCGLNLGDNQLTGNIPPELGNLSLLGFLILSGNRLTGGIPQELGNLSNLSCLHLMGNQLAGDIPSNIANLERLYLLDIGYNGLYAKDEILQKFLNERQPNWELTQTIAPTDISAVPSSSSAVTISWKPILYTDDSGAYYIYYSMAPGGTRTLAGKTADKTISSYTVSGLTPGTAFYFAIRAQTDPHANNANTLISEESEETACAIGSIGPFGSFDTPLTGSTVCSSIPVTGWALDDLGVASVQIYRDEEKEGKLVYIGTADFVEGARPDIEQAYPGYPNNRRAGWGYMMLTNFLPNEGNGTFTLQAIATDIEGNQTVLGTKTIICDNAHAVKPFGAIDTPAQGGIASGGRYRNYGWVLTPMPNMIPTDGSTLHVYMDGVCLGHPVYNVYGSDISGLFPGYANSEGAVAYFDFNTTTYANGVHTIYWTAMDNAGNADGIGSRYFVIQNADAGRGNPSWLPASLQLPNRSSMPSLPDISNIPVDYSSPVGMITGYNRDAEPRLFYPNGNGIISIEIKELDRFEMIIGEEQDMPADPPHEWTGFQLVGAETRPLPVGSTLNTEKGIFYWSPGPGFIGTYRFGFVKKSAGDVELKYVNVIIRGRGIK